ncbi:sigma-54 interaction domain-containing protein [Thalassotalea sediminis]|uniref:sigma-54 interaction domain-containing protein n=1 Tax=Thalassotalea sediminis TaxID=1759089 RepID=UPI0025732947|nr:sigma 54-interacting transcriptional regulator [Thalassotalea sediminis]
MQHSIIQSTINAIEKPVIFLDLNYRIRAVNKAYEDLYTKKVIVGKSRCHEISHNSKNPCDQHGEDCPIKTCMQSQKATSVVHIHQTEQGKQFCDILMRPVKNEHGKIIGFLEILEQINFASAELAKDKMIGESEPFKHMLKQINRAAKSDIAVLLQGETGTGKELVAKALHEGSHRNEKPFVIIECTGLNETLFESELFGHEKGAFTGATHTKKGLIEIAHGGTVFFDEIGDVPLNMQVKLLRLLETRSFRSVGGLKQKKADFRFLSASHKNLKELMEKGLFREDLYYRIAGFPIYLPPLRERKVDIKSLVIYFLNHSEYKNKTYSDKALLALEQYNFPGNIRELRNIIEQSVLLSDEDTVCVEDLPPYIQETSFTQLPDIVEENTNLMTLETAEKKYLAEVTNTFEGNIEDLATQLNVSVRTLYRKLNKYQLKL